MDDISIKNFEFSRFSKEKRNVLDIDITPYDLREYKIYIGEKMTHNIITCISPKGGSGNTTTVQALATGITRCGYECLVIDLNPNMNLTMVSKGRCERSNKSIYEIMNGECSFEKARRVSEYYDYIEGNVSLYRADNDFTGKGKEYILKNILTPLKEKYEYILIDAPSSLGILTINSLVASDYVIIPTEQSFYALQGLDPLYYLINEVKNKYNKKLEISGIVFTKYTEKAKIYRELNKLIEEYAEEHNLGIYTTVIRQDSNVLGAQGIEEDIYRNVIIYNFHSKLNNDYMELAYDVIDETQGDELPKLQNISYDDFMSKKYEQRVMIC